MLNLPKQPTLIQLKDIHGLTQYSFYKQSMKDEPFYTGICWNTNKEVKIKSISIQYRQIFPYQFNSQIQKIKQINNIENLQSLFLDCFGIQIQNKFIYLVMENWKYNLSEIIVLKQQEHSRSQQTNLTYINDNDCIKLAKLMYNALKNMSQNNIQFKGLTSYDILFTEEYIKIAIDISLQNFQRRNNHIKKTTRGSLTQRIPYMSPQTKITNNLNSQQFKQKCNVWAFGCILLEIMINELPWSEKYQKIDSFNRFKQKVLPRHFPVEQNCQLKFKPEDQVKFNSRPLILQQLVRKCLTYNDLDRPNLIQLEPLIKGLNNISKIRSLKKID